MHFSSPTLSRNNAVRCESQVGTCTRLPFHSAQQRLCHFAIETGDTSDVLVFNTPAISALSAQGLMFNN
jgi:hypothetical protein